MTVKEVVTSSSLYSPRHGFSNFMWTTEAIDEWEAVWDALWRIGIKWDWQNTDKYARRYGDTFTLFAVHNDAIRLDMTIPLPNRDIILDIHEYLLDLPEDDFNVDTATNLIRGWIGKYYDGKI
jgi:hypothetical protein